jgi:hypothetical protein
MRESGEKRIMVSETRLLRHVDGVTLFDRQQNKRTGERSNFRTEKTYDVYNITRMIVFKEWKMKDV